MSNKEYSAVDAIYIILEKISNIEDKLDLIDSNLKEINNKVYVLNSRIAKMKKESAITKEVAAESASPTAQAPSNSQNNYTAKKEVQENSGLFLGKIKLYGYIKNTDRNPIHGVKIELLKGDSKIREFSSNRDGYWEARLPSGQYKVIYTLRGYKPVSKIIDLLDSMKEFEVE